MIFDDFQGPWIAPSILSADFLNIGEELKSLEQAGADAIHLDIMDGHFVPNISFGPAFVEAVRRGTELPLIAHMMIEDPLKYGTIFAEAGVEAISFHIESVDNPFGVVERIRSLDALAGIAIKPSTHIRNYEKLAENADFILIMSVEPGFSGQSFKEIALERIDRFTRIREELGLEFKIEVDGGVKGDNSELVRDAGADILVSASYILGSSDRKKAIETLRG